MCAVYDVKAEAYGRPMFVPAVGLAMRAFMDEIKNQKASSVSILMIFRCLSWASSTILLAKCGMSVRC